MKQCAITHHPPLRRALHPLCHVSFPAGRAAQESRKHYNQLEEARKQQHARKLKLEAQEVALGERDRVTATMGDAVFMGERERRLLKLLS